MMAAATAKRVPIPRNGVDYRGKIVLAPMVRSGECPSRLMALQYGADLVWGPETIDRALIGTTRRENPLTKTIDFSRIPSDSAKNSSPTAEQKESIIYRLHPSREGRKLIHQIGTANPETAVEAAKLIAGDVAGIDVNAGCPKPFSTLGGMGAALLKTPEKLCAILRALVAEVGTPFEIGISVKIRLLDNAADTEALVRSLCATGITGLTIHCRTTPMRPRERAIREQLRMIVDVCHEAGVACLMNGDVASRDEAMELMSQYGADGAMIATEAEKNPSVFRAGVDGGKAEWDEVVREYVRTSLEVENRWGNTKYLLGQMIPGKDAAYKSMQSAKSYSELVSRLGYDDMRDSAKDIDQRLEIGEYERPRMTKAERKAANKAAAKANAATTKSDMTNPAQQSSEGKGNTQAQTGQKRSADVAQLDMPPDTARTAGPGSLAPDASILAV